eukprot:gnl/TRDRNA2_/TRDRNA2_43868_c0_seq1.p1 gnl/TRDRNA2_/TRDRNA2_43868_c0~~gnl/TRDRNA2_/TRDRNA2_43868_c0_seq1.p1  ORF type:complete len:348 (+),score=45.66 gnl/TRDRNA2_/TRDRNA2_43868_c0_seq1:39-1046(+)
MGAAQCGCVETAASQNGAIMATLHRDDNDDFKEMIQPLVSSSNAAQLGLVKAPLMQKTASRPRRSYAVGNDGGQKLFGADITPVAGRTNRSERVFHDAVVITDDDAEEEMWRPCLESARGVDKPVPGWLRASPLAHRDTSPASTPEPQVSQSGGSVPWLGSHMPYARTYSIAEQLRSRGIQKLDLAWTSLQKHFDAGEHCGDRPRLAHILTVGKTDCGKAALELQLLLHESCSDQGKLKPIDDAGIAEPSTLLSEVMRESARCVLAAQRRAEAHWALAHCLEAPGGQRQDTCVDVKAGQNIEALIEACAMKGSALERCVRISCEARADHVVFSTL